MVRLELGLPVLSEAVYIRSSYKCHLQAVFAIEFQVKSLIALIKM